MEAARNRMRRRADGYLAPDAPALVAMFEAYVTARRYNDAREVARYMERHAFFDSGFIPRGDIDAVLATFPDAHEEAKRRSMANLQASAAATAAAEAGGRGEEDAEPAASPAGESAAEDGDAGGALPGYRKGGSVWKRGQGQPKQRSGAGRGGRGAAGAAADGAAAVLLKEESAGAAGGVATHRESAGGFVADTGEAAAAGSSSPSRPRRR